MIPPHPRLPARFRWRGRVHRVMAAEGPERIDPACQECHETHDVPAREVLKRWKERCPDKTDTGKIVCTDCHGYHRLPKRSVRWNKKTGDLIIEKKSTTADKNAEKTP